MNKLFNYFLVATMLLAFACGSEEKAQETETAEVEMTEAVEGAPYTVDAAASKVEWAGKKAAYGHNGTIGIKEGELSVADGKVVGGSFVIDMATIKDLDIQDDEEKNGKLVGHLSSDDFFGVETYPTSSFVITSANNTEGNKYEITGDLTIRDTTHSITFPAQMEVSDAAASAKAIFAIDRSKWGVKYNSGVFFVDMAADKIISDEINFIVSLEAAPAAQAE